MLICRNVQWHLVQFFSWVSIQRRCTVQTCVWRQTLLSAASWSQRSGPSSRGKCIACVYICVTDVFNGSPCWRSHCCSVPQERDVKEGADMLMVKPGLPYLDIMREVKDKVRISVGLGQCRAKHFGRSVHVVLHLYAPPTSLSSSPVTPWQCTMCRGSLP